MTLGADDFEKLPRDYRQCYAGSDGSQQGNLEASQHVSVSEIRRPAAGMHGQIGQRLLSEDEWRHGLGLKMTPGWQHYLVFGPEPNVLMFRRPLGTDLCTGEQTPSYR